MIRKILSLSLVAVILSVTALAAPGAVTLNAVYAADEDAIFTYASSEVESVSEKSVEGDVTVVNATHAKDLPVWAGGVSAYTKAYDADGVTALETPEEVAAVDSEDTLTSVVENGVVWYEIGSGDDLAAFGKLCQSYIATTATTTATSVALNARLVADVDLGDKNFASYRLAVNSTVNKETDVSLLAYAGTVDGQGHSIYRLVYKGGSHYNPGYIGSLSGGTVKNLNIIDADSYFISPGSSQTTLGAILVSNGGSGTIENVYISGDAHIAASGDVSKRWFATYGTFVSRSYNVQIKNCHSAVNVDVATNYPAGGLAGEGNNTKYKTLHIGTGTSSSGYTNNHGIGGIVGTAYHNNATSGTDLVNCHNSGNIYAPNYRRVGGIMGSLNYKSHSYSYCSNSGDITGYGDVAGIVGFVRSNVSTSGAAYNTGNITAVAVQDAKDDALSRVNDNAYAAGIAIGGAARSATAPYVYNTGDVRVMNNGVGEYTESTVVTDPGADGEEGTEDDVTETVRTYNGRDIYDATATPVHNNYTAQLFVSDVTAHAASETAVYSTDVAAIAYSKPVKSTDDNGTPDDTSDDVTVTTQTETALGQGYARSEIKASCLNEKYVDDFGINGGLPIFAAQLDALTTDADTIEIGSYTNEAETAIVKTAGVNLKKAGYVALDVTPITESATIAIFDGEEKVSEVTVTEAGMVALAAPKNATIKAEGRALIVVKEEVPVENITATAIKAGIPSEESATVVVALYAADGSLKKVIYNANAEVVNVGTEEVPSNEVSAVLDLNGVDVAGCTLRAFIWKNGSLEPVSADFDF